MIKSLFMSGLKSAAEAEANRQRAPKPVTRKVSQMIWALTIADGVLRRKSGNKKFSLDMASAYEHPHLFMANINSGDSMDSALIRFETDIRNALAAQKPPYNTQVSVRNAPLRLEITKTKPEPIHFVKFWPRICSLPIGEWKFNGIVHYEGATSKFLNFSVADERYSHCAFTGATGSGKTVLLLDALLSLTMRTSPEQLSVLLCDKTGLNLGFLSGLPHLSREVAKTPLDISRAVRWVHQEMIERAGDHSAASRRIVLVIDEFDNTLSEDPDLIEPVIKIVKEGRARGIHLWICCQKLAGNLPPNLYGQIGGRFVGPASSQAEARINAGDDTKAHQLKPKSGLFELSNGVGSTPGPVLVRSLLIADRKRDVPIYVAHIQQRWEGKRPHFKIGRLEEERMERAEERAERLVQATVLQRHNHEDPIRASHVMQIWQDLTGKTMTKFRAEELLVRLGLLSEMTTT